MDILPDRPTVRRGLVFEKEMGVVLKRALIAAVVLLVLLSGYLIYEDFRRTLELAMADGQTQIFEECRNKALKLGPEGAARELRYIVFYYPSGTKQRKGSRMDRLVERQRTLAIESIIAHLRTKIGSDLGDKPEPWIEKYATK